MLFLSPPLNYEYRIYLIKYIIIFNIRICQCKTMNIICVYIKDHMNIVLFVIFHMWPVIQRMILYNISFIMAHFSKSCE